MIDALQRTNQAQFKASDPTTSAFVGANAGSGKTRVLTSRIARLLLDNVDPSHVLCVTYTKAAAGEIQNRIFSNLAKWVLMDDDKLTVQLREIGENGPFSSDKLRSARRLFAKALETPGGLKVQTIHAFASTILRRFPIEAGVSPNFREMSKDQNIELIRKAQQIIIAEDTKRALIYAKELPLKKIDEWQANLTSFEPLTANQLSMKFNSRALGDQDNIISEILKVWQSAPESLASELNGYPQKYFNQTRDHFHQMKYAEGVKSARLIFVTKEGVFRNINNKVNLHAFRENLWPLIYQYFEIEFWQKQELLYEFGSRLRTAYEELKVERGYLDYDDLIQKCAKLLNTADGLNWVMYRLDGSIDHILIDEAQDTNPEQWGIFDALVEQIPVAPNHRTVFVVGDYKQSIYGFQGADPGIFRSKQEEYGKLLQDHQKRFHIGELQTSFRSSPIILDFVDQVFRGDLSVNMSEEMKHLGAKENLSGSVELWPYMEESGSAKSYLWPDQNPEPNDDIEHEIARDLAAMIYKELQDGRLIEDGDVTRKVRPGDYLILTRKRTKIYSPIQKELQKLGVPIAGVDKLELEKELACLDMMAALRYVHAPFDEFSLACFLKSPFCGLTDRDLYKLRQDGKSLFEALREQEGYREIVHMIEYLHNHKNRLRPYDLISSFLVRFDGEAKLRSRLGIAVNDVIQLLLSKAYLYEQEHPASFAGFIHWFDHQSETEKRNFEEGIDAVRVMSMHGAKGLEAPIVILPMIDSRDKTNSLIKLKEGVITGSDFLPEAIKNEKELSRSHDEEEEKRILYVALTRARSRLIILCSGKSIDKVKEGDTITKASSLYTKLKEALEMTIGELKESGGIMVKTYGSLGSCIETQISNDDPKHLELSPIPAQKSDDHFALSEVLPKLTSRNQKTSRGADFGSQIHRMIELWRVAQSYPDPRSFFDQDSKEFTGLFAETEALIKAYPELARDGVLFETVFTHKLENRQLSGRIDALIREGHKIRVIDFKSETDTTIDFAKLEERYQKQISFYAHLIAEIYPDCEVQAEIIWTYDQRNIIVNAEVYEAVYNEFAQELSAL